VQGNTSHVQVVESLFPNSPVILLAPTVPAFYGSFAQGYCNVLAGEQFDLAEGNVMLAGYNDSYSFSTNLYSKEPIALVTRDDDMEWSDYVNWVFLALLTAENRTITQQFAHAIIQNPAPSVDLTQLQFYQAVATVGNYGEMYTRHLRSIVPRAPVNEQNDGTTPLICSFPFGNTNTTGPGPVVNGTLDKILERGYLRCGIAETPFFATFNDTTQEFEGFDIDYCRAVSSAVFNGTGLTFYVTVTGNDRWDLLANGDVDLVSWDTTWNYQCDVDEPSTKTGFTFAQPNFYTGLQFGGVPL
jgi:ABC-type amino acid transport substrate-binding protein